MTERAELATILAEMQRRGIGSATRLSRYVPHRPEPKQAQFLALDCLEALYGGAAGGGKSDALLMDALANVHVPGYAAILFRRTYSDLALPGAIMDRSHQWLAGTDAHWVGDLKTWRFPSGATLSFGYMDNDRDRYRYQGSELQYIGWDELTQIPRAWYLYLMSRLRRLQGSTVPLKSRGATNPGGIGHKWVFDRFVDPRDPQGPFIPSTLDDNPWLDRESYEISLAKLDPTTLAQLRHGVWVQDSSGLVYSSFHRGLVVPYPGETKGWRRILSFDFGNVDDTAWAILGWARHSRVVHVLQSEKRSGMIPSECGELANDLMGKHQFDRIVGDFGGLGKGYAEEMRRRYHVPIEPAAKENKLGYIKLLNGSFHNREMLVCEGNEAYVTELEELAWHDDNKQKESAGFANHLADCMLYGFRAAVAYSEPDAPEALTLDRQEDQRIKRLEQQLRSQRKSPLTLRKGF